MSWRIRFSIACFVQAGLWPASSFAQFPYEAVVTTRVKVRSGASENHYQTGYLETGDRVIVVRDAGSGWLAIEPPKDSFSWICAGDDDKVFVREINSKEGEVVADNVLVRIGTRQDDRFRDYPQIKLKRGDRVEILDKKTSGQGQLAKLWYKISPPAGEVRFISAQFVQAASGRRPAQRQNTSSITRPPGADDELPRPRPGKMVEEDPDERMNEVDSNTPPVKNAPGRNPLERANIAYKEMMSRSIAEREVARVRTLYEQAAEWAQDDADHALIAQRLEELQMQQARKAKYDELNRLLSQSKQRDEAILSLNRKKEGDSTAAAPRFDGSGVLRRSSAMIDGKPAFTLGSPQGGIRYYVTPSPGIDLTKYLDQTVAVRGPVRYRMEVRAQHITVRDVTPIELRR